MAAQAAQMPAMCTALLGWLLVIVACSLPTWKVTAFVGGDVVTAQLAWKGLWTTCAAQSTGHTQCRSYDSVRALPPDLQAARGMTVMSIATGICGAVVSVIGGRCTGCMENQRSKAKACVLAGVFFVISGSLCVVSVSWSAYSTITSFYHPLTSDAQRYELGAALYVGWAAAALLLTGGGLLCLNCPPTYEHTASVPTFTPVSSTATSKECV